MEPLRELVELLEKRAPLDGWVRENELQRAFEQSFEPGPLLEVAARAGDHEGFRRAILACVDDVLAGMGLETVLGEIKHDAKELAAVDEPYWLRLIAQGLVEPVECATRAKIDNYVGLVARDAMTNLIDAVIEARSERREAEGVVGEEGEFEDDESTGLLGAELSEIVRKHIAPPHLARVGGFTALAFGAPPIATTCTATERASIIRFNVEALRARYAAIGLELRAPSSTPVRDRKLAVFPKLVRDIYEGAGGIDLTITSPKDRGPWPTVDELAPLCLVDFKTLVATATGGLADIVVNPVGTLSVPVDPSVDDPPLYFDGEPSGDLTLLGYLRSAFASGGLPGLAAKYSAQAKALASGLSSI